MSDSPVIPSVDAIKAAEADRQAAYIEYKADLIYGPSDSGKTVNVGKASQYVLSKYGLLSRMVTADGGGVGPLKGLVSSGQLEVWSVGAWQYPIAAMQKAVKGWWPARLDDPEAPLLPPDAGTWEIYGFYGFEGLTSWGDAIMLSLKADRASLSQDPSYVYNQGGESFAGGNKSYFGFIQDQLYAWVTLSHMLPVKNIVWTALESKGDDQDGQPVYGPSIAGKKAIAKATQWFGNSLHIDMLSKPSKEVPTPDGTKLLVTEVERVMWLKTHADSVTKVNYPAKVRVPVEYAAEVPSYLIPPDICKVYELLAKLEAKQQEDSHGKMAEIEGVRERLVKAAAAAKEKAEKAAMAKRARATVTVPGSVYTPSVGAGVVVRPFSSAAVPIAPSASGIPQAAEAVIGKVAEPGHVPTIQTLIKK